MYCFGMSCFRSLRVWLATSSVVVLLGLILWSNFHTSKALRSLSLENTRVAAERTATTLGFALRPLVNSVVDSPDLASAKLDEWVRGSSGNIVYLAFAGEHHDVLIKSRGTPPGLPSSDVDFGHQIDAGMVHVMHPVEWRGSLVRYIYFGMATHVSHEAVGELLSKNLFLSLGGLAVAVLVMFWGVLSPNGESARLVSLGIEATEKKRAEASLKASNEEWRETFNAVTDPIAVLDDHMCIVKANRAFGALSGQPVAGLLGKQCTICEKYYEHPDSLCPHAVKLVKEPGRVVESTEEIGSGRFRVTTSPLLNHNGELRGAVCVSHKVSKAHAVEEERLSLLEHQQDTLIREVHHRIKNHLQGVIGLLRQTQTDHPEVARVIGEAVNRVVSIATVYGLQSESANASLDLALLLEGIMGNTMDLSPQVPFSMESAECERAWEVASDKAVALALVLNELMLNAVKHSPDGGSGVDVSCRGDKDYVSVVIANSGNLPNSWDYQSGNGLGTGLDLVRHMLPRKGSELSIAEEANKVVAVLTLRPPLVSAVG